MKKVLISGLLAACIIVPNYSATETEVANLTEEQQTLKDEISKSTSKIDEYQDQLNSAKAEIANNDAQIEELNANIEELNALISDKSDATADALVQMQRMSNQNSFIKYLVDDNGQNFFLKFQNMGTLTDIMSSDIAQLITTIEKLNTFIDEVETIKATNIDIQNDAEKALSDQQQEESDLRDTSNRCRCFLIRC